MSGTVGVSSKWWFLLCVLIVCGSLAVAWIAGVLSSLPAGRNGHVVEWQAADLSHATGSGSSIPGAHRLVLDTQGRALLPLPLADLSADAYRFLTIEVESERSLTHAVLLWSVRSRHDPLFIQQSPPIGPLKQASLPIYGWSGIWLDLSSLPEWSGDLARVGIALQGPPGAEVSIRQVRLAPDTMANRLAWFFAGWARYDPLAHWSINVFKGNGIDPPIKFRMPFVVTFLAVGLFLYGLLLASRRFRSAFDWRVAGGLLLIAWFAMDAPWQWQLWRQAMDAEKAFGGKSQDDKALSGPDASIYQLTRGIDPLLGPPSARVFIATSQEYLGLRAAYRLYPHNPYWARGRVNELPSASQLKPGDFVLTLRSTVVKYEPESGELQWPDDQRISAERLYADPTGQLYRVL